MIKPELVERIIARQLQGWDSHSMDLHTWTLFDEGDELILNVDADCTTYSFKVKVTPV